MCHAAGDATPLKNRGEGVPVERDDRVPHHIASMRIFRMILFFRARVMMGYAAYMCTVVGDLFAERAPRNLFPALHSRLGSPEIIQSYQDVGRDDFTSITYHPMFLCQHRMRSSTGNNDSYRAASFFHNELHSRSRHRSIFYSRRHTPPPKVSQRLWSVVTGLRVAGRCRPGLVCSPTQPSHHSRHNPPASRMR